MSNNDALNKIENIVNNAISSQLKTIKDQADDNETKIQFTIKELHSMLSAIHMEIQHIKERLDRVGTVFANPDEETKAAPTVKRAKKKAAAADVYKRQIYKSTSITLDKNVKDLISRCSN